MLFKPLRSTYTLIISLILSLYDIVLIFVPLHSLFNLSLSFTISLCLFCYLSISISLLLVCLPRTFGLVCVISYSLYYF